MFPPDSLNLQERLAGVWRNITLFSSLSLRLSSFSQVLSSSVNSWSTFLSKFIGHFPSLVVSLHALLPVAPLLSIITSPSSLHSPHSPSLLGWLQIGYFLHAPSRALIRGRVLIVGLSLRLTDSSACAAEMPDLVNVCLWGLISTPYINCLDSMCRQSLSILLHSPHPLSLFPFNLCILCCVFQPSAHHFAADPPVPSFFTLELDQLLEHYKFLFICYFVQKQ